MSDFGTLSFFFFRSWSPSWAKKGGPGGGPKGDGLRLHGGLACFGFEMGARTRSKWKKCAQGYPMRGVGL